MAKKSQVMKNLKRQKYVDRYAEKRSKLLSVIKDPKTSIDEKRLAYHEIEKMPRDASPTFQERAKNIPNPVATAFPPLPLSHNGQICPEIADMPAITSINPWSV